MGVEVWLACLVLKGSGERENDLLKKMEEDLKKLKINVEGNRLKSAASCKLFARFSIPIVNFTL